MVSCDEGVPEKMEKSSEQELPRYKNAIGMSLSNNYQSLEGNYVDDNQFHNWDNSDYITIIPVIAGYVIIINYA